MVAITPQKGALKVRSLGEVLWTPPYPFPGFRHFGPPKKFFFTTVSFSIFWSIHPTELSSPELGSPELSSPELSSAESTLQGDSVYSFPQSLPYTEILSYLQ